MRKLLVTILFALGAGVAFGVDYDIEQMQARLAEQEAKMAAQGAQIAEQNERLADLHAKLANGNGDHEGNPEGIISLQKNAVVTIGGLVNTRYQHTRAKVDSIFDGDNDYAATNDYRRRATARTSSLEITDAELHVQVDINEHVEAFLLVNLHNGAEDDFYNAEAYYVRWKDICNSGFGIKVGRDALVFGEEGIGELDSYAASNGNGLGDLDIDGGFYNFGGFINDAGESFGGMIPLHNAWDISGVTQVTPYWEGFDGKLSAEVSFFQNVYEDRPYAVNTPDTIYVRTSNSGVKKYRSRNYGIGSLSARVQWTPIEDLKFTFSFANYRSKRPGGSEDGSEDYLYAKNNTVYGIAANWRPSFFNRLAIWGQWIHGENVYFFDDMKSDVLNFGASFDIKEGLTFFAQGDYLRTKYDFRGNDQKGTAWAFYTGLQYSLPYGVSMEAGWRHEVVKWKDHGRRYAKAKADTFYMMCGLEF